MHFNPDKKASASKFYPRTGRTGKKMTGGANKMAIRRQKLMPLFRKWVKTHNKKFGIDPTGPDQRQAIDNPGKMACDIDSWTANIPTVTFRHDKENCECKGCLGDRASGGRKWSEVFKDYFDGEAQLVKDKADKLIEEEKEIEKAYADARERASLKEECVVPYPILKRYSTGEIGIDVVIMCFNQLTKKDVDGYLWAYQMNVPA